MALAVFIVGKPLISLVFGVKSLEAYDLIQVMLGAIVISMLGFPQEFIAIDGGKTARFSRGANHRLNRLHRIAVHVLSSVWCAGSSVCFFGGQCLDVALSLIPTLKAFFQRHSLLYNAAGEKS